MVDENPSSGYMWIIEKSSECDKIVGVESRLAYNKNGDPWRAEIVHERQTGVFTPAQDLPAEAGVGGTKYIALRPLAIGECQFRMAHARQWEFSWDRPEQGNAINKIEFLLRVAE